jgi:hypothetical protein
MKVEFYANGQKIGESASPPYCTFWENIPVGVYAMTAVATDNEGATATFAPVEVEIKPAFEARILTPTNGQVFVRGEQIRLTTSTTNAEGAVTLNYEFDGYAGFPQLTNAPYEFTTTAYSLGRHSISVIAVQDPWQASPYALYTPVYIYVIPARGFPIITAQPTNQLVSVGTDVVLAVSAFAELPVSYQWQFNGANIPNATNDHLMLPNIHSEQAGSYSVLVSTAAGVLPSNRAFIDVWRPRAGTILFANRVVSNGVTLVDAPVSLPASKFEARIYAGPRPNAMVLLEPARTFSNAYFDGGTRSVGTDNGTVYVRINVSSDESVETRTSGIMAIQTGNAETPTPLRGLAFAPPRIPPLTPDPYFSHDRDWLETGTFGGEVALRVGVQSYAQRVRYQWQKDGRDIPGASGEFVRTNFYPLHGVAALALTNLQISDAASYRVRVEPAANYPFSGNALLALIEPDSGRFLCPTLRNGAWQTELRAGIGRRYAIQFSSDLVNWETISTVTNSQGNVPVQCAPRSSTGNGFYRALLVP